MKSLLGRLLNAAGNPPVPYTSRGAVSSGNILSRNTKQEQNYAMASLGDVFSIVTLLASTTSSVDWQLYRKPTQDMRQRYQPSPGPTTDDQRVQVVQHPALYLWENPNPFHTSQMFVEGFQQHLELTGEAYWLVDYAGTIPTSLWVANPSRIEPVPSRESYLAGYVYTSPDGEQIPLTTTEVIQLKYPNPWDPYHGLGPVQAILVDVENVRYSATWNRNFWVNNATPGGIIEVPTNWSDTEFNTFTTRWRETHRGVSAAGRVGLIEGGAKWVDAQQSMRNMQGAELRQVSQDSIRRAWGIHKHMLGDADDVNRANAETAEETFVRWKTVPRLDRIKDVLNHFWLPLFGPLGANVEFDYTNPVPEDREAANSELTAKAGAAAQLVTAGYDPEAVLEACGLPSMPFVGKAPAAAPAAEPDDASESLDEEDQEALDEMTALLRATRINGHRNHLVGAS